MDISGRLAMGASEEGPAAEAALLRAGRAGDLAALERLVARHKRALFALCYGILGHPDDAEDAVQESFLRALRALPRFRGDATFRTWLYRIAVNVCLEWKAARRPIEPWDEEQAGPVSLTLSPEVTALRRLRMIEALNSLRPPQRAALLLKELEGWSMAEIGAALRWNEKRVENELYRARRALLAWRTREAEEGADS